MKSGMFNMSQDVLYFRGRCRGVDRTGQWQKEGFYGTEERSVSQGDILDTSLNVILTVFHFLCPDYGWTCMQFCPLRARECVYECVCKGGLHAPQSDLDSLSSPHHLFSLSFFFLTLVSCRAGNLLNSHIYSELWCCPKTHRHTGQVHVVWTTPLKEFFLSSLVS